MKLLITGGAGFMGSNMIRYMLDTYPGASIVNLDKLTYAGNLANLKDIEDDSRYEFVKGDIADEALVDRLLGEHKFDAIVNYAADTHVDRSIQYSKEFLNTNVIGTYVLLEGVRKHGVPRMIQISTDEVFGDILEGTFREESPFKPSNPYSAAKAGGDHMCAAYFRTYQVPVIVTHSCNFYGPYQYPEKLIPLFVTNLIDNQKVPVYGDGNQVREWIYTEDHCRAIDAILKKGKDGEVYNIGTGDEKKNIETTRLILKLLGKDEGSIEHVKDRAGHDVRYAVDHGKIASELGWEPAMDYEEGMRKTVHWYMKNEQWWRPIKSGEFRAYYERQYEGR